MPSVRVKENELPIYRGGGNAWTNVVTACSSSNTRKGNRLPSECGMHPLHPPVEPHFVHLAWSVRKLTSTQSKYIRLFYVPRDADRPRRLKDRDKITFILSR